MKVFIFVIIVVATSADYHDEVGIPLAARIKAYEDEIFANPEMESRVVGGEIAPVNEYPYMAGLVIKLKNNNTFISTCGSSLVTTTRLVTAAHCLKRAESLKIRMGTPYIFHGGIQMYSKDFSMHLNYDSWNNDIGVVRLSEQVQLSETIQLVNLPSTMDEVEVEGEIAFAAGWGLTSDDDRGKSTPNSVDLRLSHVGLKIISNQVCFNLYQHHSLENNICTDGTGGVGMCSGDSGGPLVVTRNNRKILVGVTASGGKLCQTSSPTVFTRVESYKDFIMNF